MRLRDKLPCFHMRLIHAVSQPHRRPVFVLHCTTRGLQKVTAEVWAEEYGTFELLGTAALQELRCAKVTKEGG